jgi:uncharacterized protein
MEQLTSIAAELAPFVAAMAAAGVVAGLLAGVFGIGGGAVLVPVFYQVFGLIEIDEAVRMHLAVGSSLGIIVPTSIRSFMAHKARGAVDMEVLRSFLIAVPVGVVLASLTAAYISSEGLRAVFAAIMVLVGVRCCSIGKAGASAPRCPAIRCARWWAWSSASCRR